jgi:hypothetical protein
VTRRTIAGACAVSLAASVTVACATAATAATAGSAASAGSAALAEPGAVCEEYATRIDPVTQQVVVVCVDWRIPPGRDRGDEDEDGDGQGEDDGCWWEVYPLPDGVVPDRPAGVSPDAVLYWQACLNSVGRTVVGPEGAQWFEPAQAPAPSPAQVATQLRVQVAARLTDPVVATSPPEWDPSVVTVPTFVAVTNWQGEVVEPGCDETGTVCVTIRATPTLTFDPGEPGARVITCEPGGTRYDPDGPPADAQAAADGACAHAYRRRTGVRGRPDAWPASLTIDWEISWEGAGQTGTFADMSVSTSVDREVEEVQAVVVDGSP